MTPLSVTDPEMRHCIQQCQRCHDICLETAMHHCLEQGGKHVEPKHFRLMLGCAEICRTAADSMLGGFPLHKSVCGVCAQACEACADSCERIGDMSECVQACRHCADTCRRMAASGVESDLT